MKQISSKDIQRIVVRGTNWVGDAVMSVPALRRLRRLLPQAHITLVVRPRVEALFADADFIDSLLVYDRQSSRSALQQVRKWRSQKFDLAILFQNAFEGALIPFLAGVPLRLGYATDGRRVLLTHALQLPAWKDTRHEAFYYLNIVSHLESLLGHAQAFSSEDLDGSITVSSERRAQAMELLRTLGTRANRSTVVLCPGSINSRAKRWPAERYAQLADGMIEQQEANVLLIGTAAETEIAAEVAHRMRHEPIDLSGRTSLAEAIAVMSLADLVVTNDTGPAHIASALGRPTLVIFGPTNPLTTRPLSDAAEIIRRPPDCAPCMLRDCPIDHRCMTAISVEEVLCKSLEFLNRDAGSTFRNSETANPIEAINRSSVHQG